MDLQTAGAFIKHGRRPLCRSPALPPCVTIGRLLQETSSPPEIVKHQTNISELKRSFLETGSSTPGLTEWEKRLSSSPARSPRMDEAPMIEPLDVSRSLCVRHDITEDRAGSLNQMNLSQHINKDYEPLYEVNSHSCASLSFPLSLLQPLYISSAADLHINFLH